ncbi:MAG: hypothetical protein ACRD21_18815 [Vicinamibacteria bacterium]
MPRRAGGGVEAGVGGSLLGEIRSKGRVLDLILDELSLAREGDPPKVLERSEGKRNPLELLPVKTIFSSEERVPGGGSVLATELVPADPPAVERHRR